MVELWPSVGLRVEGFGLGLSGLDLSFKLSFVQKRFFFVQVLCLVACVAAFQV